MEDSDSHEGTMQDFGRMAKSQHNSLCVEYFCPASANRSKASETLTRTCANSASDTSP
jgi:hypothetical protein